VTLLPFRRAGSVYPLNVMVLSNNMMAAVYHDRIDKAERDRVIVTTFRLVCALPPIICASAFRNLASIIGYAGSLAIVISMIVPPYLAMRSREMCQKRFGASDTPFDGPLSSPLALRCVMAAGTALLVATV
ncbi:unnamed protein product, partial [Phaeothamnion confervicola]